MVPSETLRRWGLNKTKTTEDWRHKRRCHGRLYKVLGGILLCDKWVRGWGFSFYDCCHIGRKFCLFDFRWAVGVGMNGHGIVTVWITTNCLRIPPCLEISFFPWNHYFFSSRFLHWRIPTLILDPETWRVSPGWAHMRDVIMFKLKRRKRFT